MLDQPSGSSDELPMAKDQDVLSIVIRKLGQHRICALEQMIEGLGARPISKLRVTVLPITFRMWLSVGLCSVGESGWAQIRKLFNGPHFEWNVREALCGW
ncbi:hypothetical protein D3C71_1943320 [compost metagenome]